MLYKEIIAVYSIMRKRILIVPIVYIIYIGFALQTVKSDL
jgi:hypothetical protein